jgi:hypothetical protein
VSIQIWDNCSHPIFIKVSDLSDGCNTGRRVKVTAVRDEGTSHPVARPEPSSSAFMSPLHFAASCDDVDAIEVFKIQPCNHQQISKKIRFGLYRHIKKSEIA